jgi:hypothetical protein
MDARQQILVLIVDKLVIGAILLLAASFVNRSMERFKNEILRKNKIRDKTFDKISLVVEKVWECSKAYKTMLAAFAKVEGVGAFRAAGQLSAEDPNFAKSAKAAYEASAGEFAGKTTDLNFAVDSCRFWLGTDLSSKAKGIAETYLSIALGILNNDKNGKGLEAAANIDSLISAFEFDAKRSLA